jgi:hypothetical protein
MRYTDTGRAKLAIVIAIYLKPHEIYVDRLFEI